MKNIIGKVEILQQKLKKIEYSSDNKKMKRMNVILNLKI